VPKVSGKKQDYYDVQVFTAGTSAGLNLSLKKSKKLQKIAFYSFN